MHDIMMQNHRFGLGEGGERCMQYTSRQSYLITFLCARSGD
jgi:hypothetical protein